MKKIFTERSMIDCQMTRQQSDTTLKFWEIFNTRIVTKELKSIDTRQNDKLPSNQGKILGSIKDLIYT